MSPAEVIDAVRAAEQVGLANQEDLRGALRVSFAKSPDADRVFGRTFDAFFRATGANQGSLYDRLGSLGFSPDELSVLRDFVGEIAQGAAGGSGTGAGTGSTMFARFAEGGVELEKLLAVAGRETGLSRMQSRMQVGYYATRVFESLALGGLDSSLTRALREALGERGDELAAAVLAELAQLRVQTRQYVLDQFERRHSLDAEQSREARLAQTAFAMLKTDDVARVRREVERLGDKLRGAIAVRRRRRRRGSIDLRRTLRLSLATGGVPVRLVHRRRPDDRPRLVVLVDVSDSVRASARFLLLAVYLVQEAFAKTRTMVFVSDLAEATEVFDERPIEEAIALAYGGSVVNVASNSNYGAVWDALLTKHHEALGPKVTLVIVGDARSNYNEPNVSGFRAVASKVRRVVWLNPEAKGAWGFGDSVMPLYKAYCDDVLPVSDLSTLREAVTKLALRT